MPCSFGSFYSGNCIRLHVPFLSAADTAYRCHHIKRSRFCSAFHRRQRLTHPSEEDSHILSRLSGIQFSPRPFLCYSLTFIALKRIVCCWSYPLACCPALVCSCLALNSLYVYIYTYIRRCCCCCPGLIPLPPWELTGQAQTHVRECVCYCQI